MDLIQPIWTWICAHWLVTGYLVNIPYWILLKRSIDNEPEGAMGYTYFLLFALSPYAGLLFAVLVPFGWIMSKFTD